MPKLSVLVSDEENALIVDLAKMADRSKSDWIRDQVLHAMSGRTGAASHDAEPIITRLKQLEMRLVHENSALIQLGLFLLREGAFASTAAMAAATSTGNVDEVGADDQCRRLQMQARTVFQQLEEQVVNDLKRLRAEGKEAATALGRAANGDASDADEDQ
ncbi:MAG: hypothetical protein HC844_15070 [Tabrizicola sp.]|nr:hypothetical protein [Tabrizicola sp.]